MIQNSPISCSAFAGTLLIASGDLRDVAQKALAANIKYNLLPILIFDDATSEVIEIDLCETPEKLSSGIGEIEAARPQNSDPILPEAGARGPGRPKLGVVAHEVTLLPRHWEWLASQPGGASVTLRKLVESARRTNKDKDRLRLAQEAAYRFMSTMAGNEPGFEEAARALFAGNQERFAEHVRPWPIDVGAHAKKLAARAFENASTL
jgi:hypothetical protein